MLPDRISSWTAVGRPRGCKRVGGVNRVGFMQGRLSPLVNGKIQAFPWDHWRDEFITAQRHGFPLMEWTLDQDRLHENPLMTQPGRVEIRRLMVVPLVDHGRLETSAQEDNLRAGLEGIYPVLKQRGMKIVFESDYAPAQLATFIGSFPESV